MAGTLAIPGRLAAVARRAATKPADRTAIARTRRGSIVAVTGSLRAKPSSTILLLVILTIALGLRLWPVNFGLPALNDPDELMFELGAVHMLQTHTLNPGWFGHPATTTMYMLALVDVAVFLVGHALGWFATPAAFVSRLYLNPGWVILPGRIVMVLFGVWTVALTGRLAGRIAGEEAKWAAALLLALSPVHIAWSQVVRSDIVGCVFLILAVLSALDVMEDKPRVIRGALWCALAIASKWPFAIGGLAMIAALGWRWKTGRMPLTMALRAGIAFVALVPVLLIVIAPYLLIAHDTVLGDLAGEAQVHHLGATGGGPLTNAWWYLSGPLTTAFGMVGLLLCGLGAWTLRRDAFARVLLWPLLIVFMVVFSCQHLVWERWILPLLPFLAVFGGVGLCTLRHWLALRTGAVAGAGLALGSACLPLTLTDVAAAHARANNTAQQASAWAIAHIPPGSTVLIEHFGFDLLSQPWHMLFPFGDAGCIDPRHALEGKIDHRTISNGRGARSNVDYGTVAPDRRSTCAADYAILTQYDRYLAEKDDFPREFDAYRRLLAQGQVVATFAPRDGYSSGRFVRIVRFSSRK
ncbi:glycosyltransferase family 39 protein [Silvimonas sp.]|uniref:ArnT family glycosyltransferase n=1 Tax=Silvimonas sp. TaxID=2650811 RepID=UPI00283D0110|nr:glycosyltransferase family 39 protein [Silvimonas sp.]MDR3430280.1 glycosyltransferase family 39 protein [Silvimonas sp.]